MSQEVAVFDSQVPDGSPQREINAVSSGAPLFSHYLSAPINHDRLLPSHSLSRWQHAVPTSYKLLYVREKEALSSCKQRICSVEATQQPCAPALGIREGGEGTQSCFTAQRFRLTELQNR